MDIVTTQKGYYLLTALLVMDNSGNEKDYSDDLSSN